MIEIYDKKSYNKIEINNSLMKMSESCKDHKKGISKMNYEAITSILNDGLVLATGCTEPGALALTAATAAAHLGEEVKYIHTFASGNIIKNAYSAGIPGTDLVGIEYAVAIGAIVAKPEKQLQVINGLSAEQIQQASDMVKNKAVKVELAKVPEKLYIEVLVKGETKTAKAIIANVHTNVVYIEENSKVVLDKRQEEQSASGGYSDTEIKEILSVAKIYEYATTADLALLDKVKLSIDVNTAISNEGLANPYGLCIGRGFREDIEKGYRADSLVTYAMELASAGADARMAGADLPVVSNSGSGNQGIACTMPVVAVAKKRGVSEEQMLRAATISHLMGIYIKSQFGRLSGFCGATVAGTGSACGIVYLLGGGLKEIENAVFNMIGNVTGMLCDGAKADCALKIATCTNAAMQAALMALKGIRVLSTDGIVEDDVEKTISNFAELGNGGSVQLDQLMLEMMLKKEKAAK